MTALLAALTVATAVGSALLAGVFFAFSGFVLAALDRLPAADAARAMREVNLTAVRPPLMLALFGTAVLALAAAVLGLADGAPGSAWVVAAAAVYLVGCVGVTAAGNVPLNDALARSGGADAALAAAWAAFRPGWSRWNALRTAACTASAVLACVALRTAG